MAVGHAGDHRAQPDPAPSWRPGTPVRRRPREGAPRAAGRLSGSGRSDPWSTSCRSRPHRRAEPTGKAAAPSSLPRSPIGKPPIEIPIFMMTMVGADAVRHPGLPAAMGLAVPPRRRGSRPEWQRCAPVRESAPISRPGGTGSNRRTPGCPPARPGGPAACAAKSWPRWPEYPSTTWSASSRAVLPTPQRRCWPRCRAPCG